MEVTMSGIEVTTSEHDGEMSIQVAWPAVLQDGHVGLISRATTTTIPPSWDDVCRLADDLTQEFGHDQTTPHIEALATKVRGYYKDNPIRPR